MPAAQNSNILKSGNRRIVAITDISYIDTALKIDPDATIIHSSTTNILDNIQRYPSVAIVTLNTTSLIKKTVDRQYRHIAVYTPDGELVVDSSTLFSRRVCMAMESSRGDEVIRLARILATRYAQNNLLNEGRMVFDITALLEKLGYPHLIDAVVSQAKIKRAQLVGRKASRNSWVDVDNQRRAISPIRNRVQARETVSRSLDHYDRTLVIDYSVHGSGKTSTMAALKSELGKIGAIVPRSKLVEQYTAQFELSDYREIKEGLAGGRNGLATCVHSIKHPAIEDELFSCNSLLIDEFSKCVSSADNTGNIPDGLKLPTMELLMDLAAQAPVTWISDADIINHTRSTLLFIDSLVNHFNNAGLTCNVIYIDAPSGHPVHIDIDTQANVYERIASSCEDSHVIFSDNYREAWMANKMIGQDSVFLHGKPKTDLERKKIHRFINDIDGRHVARNLVYTSTISVGVSYTDRVYDHAWAIFNNTCTAEDCAQAIRRIRRQNHITIGVENLKDPRHHQLLEDDIRYIRANSSRIGTAELILEISSAENRAQRANPIYQLITTLIANGYEVRDIRPSEKLENETALSSEKRSTSRFLSERDVLLTRAAKAIDSNKARQLRNLRSTGALSVEEHHQLCRYEIEQLICMSVESVILKFGERKASEIIHQFHKGRLKKVTETIKLLVTDSETLKSHDESMRKRLSERKALKAGFLNRKTLMMAILKSTGNYRRGQVWFSERYYTKRQAFRILQDLEPFAHVINEMDCGFRYSFKNLTESKACEWLGKILAVLSLKTESRRVKLDDGKRQRVYRITEDSIRFVVAVMNAHTRQQIAPAATQPAQPTNLAYQIE